MAAKHTPALLPLCHTILLAGADVDVAADEIAGLVRIEARVHAIERTGVEMEALTAACAAALTVYDMMKRHDRGMELISLRLVRKSGGRSGEWLRPDEEERSRAGQPARSEAPAAPAPRPAKRAPKA
jgi:cyclic pyranopterin phosphate synthase